MIETIAISSGHEGQQRGEHEAEHDERAETAEHRLEQHAGAAAAAGLVLQRVDAR